MTERKKPGPKPKCKECGRKEGEGHYDDCPVGMGVGLDKERMDAALEGPRVTLPSDAKSPEQIEPFIAAQAYAMRVWEGQSVSLPRAERVKRIKAALEGQNLPFEGVELPK